MYDTVTNVKTKLASVDPVRLQELDPPFQGSPNECRVLEDGKIYILEVNGSIPNSALKLETIFLSGNEFKYPARHRLAGAAKIVMVGSKGSGISFTAMTLYDIMGNRIKYDIKANQNNIFPNSSALKTGAVRLPTAIPTYTTMFELQIGNRLVRLGSEGLVGLRGDPMRSLRVAHRSHSKRAWVPGSKTSRRRVPKSPMVRAPPTAPGFSPAGLSFTMTSR
jgi:hypothetical protein